MRNKRYDVVDKYMHYNIVLSLAIQQLWVFPVLLGTSSTNQGPTSQSGYWRCGQKTRRDVEQSRRCQQTTLPDKGQQAEGQVSKGMSRSMCLKSCKSHNYSTFQYSVLLFFRMLPITKQRAKLGVLPWQWE